MATILQSGPKTWLLSIQQQLSAKTGLPLERVLIALSPQVPMAHTQDLVVVLGQITASSAFLLGAGRVAPRVTRQLHIGVRTRLATDPTESNQLLLTDLTLGHLQLEDQVFDFLLDFQPTDQAGNVLLTDPIHFLGGPSPVRPERPLPHDAALSILTFEASYLQPLSSLNPNNL